MHIETGYEFGALQSFFRNRMPTAQFVIGGQRVGGAFEWILTKQAVEPSWFVSGQPDNYYGDEHCLGMVEWDAFFLGDFGCLYYPMDYVCEYEPLL